MKFDWDEQKNVINLEKHGISFATAILVFDDPNALSAQDRFENEERWQTIGLIGTVIVVLVAHTWATDNDSSQEIIRIISARKATKAERQIYEKNSW